MREHGRYYDPVNETVEISYEFDNESEIHKSGILKDKRFHFLFENTGRYFVKGLFEIGDDGEIMYGELKDFVKKAKPKRAGFKLLKQFSLAASLALAIGVGNIVSRSHPIISTVTIVTLVLIILGASFEKER